MKKIDILIIIISFLLLFSLLLYNYTEIDIFIQNYFYDFENQRWIVDSSEVIKKFIFYQFPKILLGCAILVMLVCAVFGFKKKNQFLFENRHKFLLIFLGFTLIPLTVGNIKKFTNIYCPTQLAIYNGQYPHVRIFENYPENFVQIKKGQCFPGGHAVTGFALFILFFAFQKKRNKIIGLLSAFVLGWTLSFYQIAKGAHFFSHNLVSMLACFLVAALIARIYCKISGSDNPRIVTTKGVKYN